MKLGLVAAVLLAGGLGNPRDEEETHLYFFFESETPQAPRLARKIVECFERKKPSATLRPVLLVEDWKGLGRLRKDSSLTRVLTELRRLRGDDLDIPLYDLEGLRLARAWKITKLPALAVLSGGRARVAFGDQVDPEKLLRRTE